LCVLLNELGLWCLTFNSVSFIGGGKHRPDVKSLTNFIT